MYEKSCGLWVADCGLWVVGVMSYASRENINYITLRRLLWRWLNCVTTKHDYWNNLNLQLCSSESNVGYSLMITNTFLTELLNLTQTQRFNIFTFDLSTFRPSGALTKCSCRPSSSKGTILVSFGIMESCCLMWCPLFRMVYAVSSQGDCLCLVGYVITCCFKGEERRREKRRREERREEEKREEERREEERRGEELIELKKCCWFWLLDLGYFQSKLSFTFKCFFCHFAVVYLCLHKLTWAFSSKNPNIFPVKLYSYMYMENVINHWDQMGVLQRCMEHKLVYLETKDVVETTLALDNYKKACDSGRGAVFLSIARGKVAEGIDFDNHYGRCVVLFGIPYQYTKSHVLRARLDFMREKYQVCFLLTLFQVSFVRSIINIDLQSLFVLFRCPYWSNILCLLHLPARLYPVLCCAVLCCAVLSCPVLSCHVMSCPFLSSDSTAYLELHLYLRLTLLTSAAYHTDWLFGETVVQVYYSPHQCNLISNYLSYFILFLEDSR